MKNIIAIILILVLPIFVYILMNKNSAETAVAIENSKPTLMVFTSTMCMDCKRLKEVIKDIEGEYSPKINIVSINATAKDRNVKEKIKKYNVTLVPTMIFLDKNNNQRNKIEGFIPKEELIIELEEIING